MTVGEACAVNTLLRFVLGDESLRRADGRTERRVTCQDVLNAGALLARKADKTLSAGITEKTWRERWIERATP